MDWEPVNLNKHKGLTIPQIIFKDPDYFFWAYHKDAFSTGPMGHVLACQAERAYARVTNIKIPPKDGKTAMVEFCFFEGKFYSMEVVEADRPDHEGSSTTPRFPYLDLEFLREIQEYDKLGYKNLLVAFKHHWLGGEKKRFSKKWCEEFLNNDSNFNVE